MLRNGHLYSCLQPCWREYPVYVTERNLGLKCIHEKNLIRGNLHEGDVLVEVVDGEYIDTKIVDTGLHGPFDINPQQTYRIVPFIASEIFTNKRI